MIGLLVFIVAVGALPLGVAALLRRWLLVRWGPQMGLALRRGHVLTYSFGLVGASILLGGLGGAVFGVVLSPGATELAARVLQRPPDGLLATAVAAPMTEEFGKAILLLSLFLFRRIHTSMDGLVLGLAAGLGFTTIENIVWFTVTLAEQGEEAMWTSMRVRVLFGTLVHGTSSALFGAYLGGALANGRRWVVVLAPLAALTAATVVHGAWNGLLATADGRGSYVLLALLVVLVALSVVIVLARHELWRAGFLRATWVPGTLRSRRYPERRGAEGTSSGGDVTR